MVEKAIQENLKKIDYNSMYSKKQNEKYYENKKRIFTLKMQLQNTLLK